MIKKIVKGMVIGVANAIPGVSGGTMMVSMGIYDEIIGCVTTFLSELKKSILTLLPYIIGMLLGIAGLSYGIKYLLANYALQTSMAFIGLILGSVPILTEHVKGKRLGILHVLLFLAFFALIIGMQLLGEDSFHEVSLNFSLWDMSKLFLVGVISAATMVVPGVSGSMMLMLLGYYYPIINTITLGMDGLRTMDFEKMFQAAGILFPLGIGVVLGIFVIAKLISWLLESYESHTYCAILGLVIASPIAILMSIALPVWNLGIIISGLCCLVVGFICASFLGK